MFNQDNFLDDDFRLWQIQFNRKPVSGRWADSHSINVSAITIEDALAKVRKEYPEAKMLSVQHKGKINL